MKKKHKCALYKKNKFQKNSFKKQPEKILKKYVKKLHHISVEDLKNYKPVGVTHLKHLSKILRRNIKIWSKGRLIYSSSQRFKKPEINIECEENKSGFPSTKIGHYFNNHGFPNDCLYDVLSTQTGLDPEKLKTLVTKSIRKKLNNHPYVRYPYIRGKKNFFI